MYATRITERVRMLDTYALGQPKTVCAYLVRGPKPTLVDCGYATSSESVLAGLAECGVMPSEVRYLIPTHVHLDHAGAAGRLLKEMPNATVIAHERSVKHLVDPKKLIESATRVFGEAIVRLYGAPDPVPEGRITAVGEELHLDLGDGLSVVAIHTPGHAPHQISVLLENSKSLITADAVGIVYPGMGALIPTTPPPSFDPGGLAASIRKLEGTEPTSLLVPHFGPRSDPGWVFRNTLEKVDEWVEKVGSHRKRGLGLDQIALAMEEEVEREAGVSDLPIYASVSVRTSVMGILDYLDRKA